MTASDARVRPPATGARRVARRLLRAANANVDAARLLTHGPGPDRRATLVIGDSHAVHLVDGWMPSPRVVRADRATSVIYLGPRLLHSFARDGLPAWAQRLLAARQRSPLARGEATAVLALGEIDVRCHLAKPGRADDDALRDLAEAYVARAASLLAALGPGGRVVLLGPNPPSEEYESAEGYPVVGSAEERAGILDRLCQALASAVAAQGEPRLRMLDVRPAVADADGLLRPELTFDGCHLNAAGSAMVRRMLAELDSTS